jgi:hypothetical protein
VAQPHAGTAAADHHGTGPGYHDDDSVDPEAAGVGAHHQSAQTGTGEVPTAIDHHQGPRNRPTAGPDKKINSRDDEDCADARREHG